MKPQDQIEYDPNMRAWLVWRAWHDKFHPVVIFGALPESHGGKAGWSQSPIELEGEERFWPLDMLAEKYPPFSKKGPK